MTTNVVPKNLGENSPIFEPTVDRLVPRPNTCLHRQFLGRGDVVAWALDLAWVPTIPIVGLDSLVPLKEVGEDGIKNLDLRPLAGRVQTLNPDEVPPPDVDAQLVPQGGLAGVLVGAEGVPLLRLPLLGDPEVSLSTNIRQLLPMSSTNRLSKSTCNFARGGSKKRGQGG